MLKNNNGEKVKETDPLLKCVLYCKHCNNKLQIINKKDKYKDKITQRRYIICSTAVRTVTNKTCYRQYINYDKIEKKVIDQIVNIFQQYINSNNFNKEEIIKRVINSKSNKIKLKDRMFQVTNQLNAVNKKIKTLYGDKLKGIIEEQDFDLFSESLINERHKLEELREDTYRKIEEFEKSFDKTKIEIDVEKIIRQIIEKQELKKEDIQQLINKIEIDKDKNIFLCFNFEKNSSRRKVG